MNLIEEIYHENAYKITYIIKELRNAHTGCSFDKICDAAERNVGARILL